MNESPNKSTCSGNSWNHGGCPSWTWPTPPAETCFWSSAKPQLHESEEAECSRSLQHSSSNELR